MRKDSIDLDLRSWNRLDCPGLVVRSEVLGLCHTFKLEGRTCTIRLPPRVGDDVEHTDRLNIYSYRMDGEKKVDRKFRVNGLDISVSVEAQIKMPAEVLSRHPNAFELIDSDTQTVLERHTQDCHAVSMKAYDRWLRIMRWKTDQPMLGREAVLPSEGWDTALVDCATNHRVWLGAQIIVAESGLAVTSELWQNVQETLTLLTEPPISVDFYTDAIFHLESGDLKRSVADAAIAIELFVRGRLQQSLPDTLGKEARKLLNDTNIRQVLTKLYPEAEFKLSGNETSIPSVLHKLLDDRNAIFHRGAFLELTAEKCRKYILAVRLFIAPLYTLASVD